jgi:hypothetical protein
MKLSLADSATACRLGFVYTEEYRGWQCSKVVYPYRKALSGITPFYEPWKAPGSRIIYQCKLSTPGPAREY